MRLSTCNVSFPFSFVLIACVSGVALLQGCLCCSLFCGSLGEWRGVLGVVLFLVASAVGRENRPIISPFLFTADVFHYLLLPSMWLIVRSLQNFSQPNIQLSV